MYVRRASPLHATRAGVAAAWSVVMVGAALAFEHPVVLGALLVSVLGAAAGARVLPEVLRVMRFAVPFALLIAAINPFVVREGLTVIARLGEIPPFGEVDVTLEATVYGLVLGLRAIIVLLAAAVLTATVDPDDVLRLFRRVSFRSALTAALAVRLVPVLQRDGRRLAEARRLRAQDTTHRVTVLRALATGALDRAADVAATLEVRGYRTAVKARGVHAPWSRHDIAFAVSAGSVAALVVRAKVLGVDGFEAYPSLSVATGPEVWAWCAAIVALAVAPFIDRRGIER